VRLTVVAATGLSTTLVSIHVVGRNGGFSVEREDSISLYS
jgi:hypothetical protein